MRQFLKDHFNPVKLHLAGTILWAVLFIPTMTTWKDAIPWLAFMSCYANFVGHWSAYQAARAEKAERERERAT